MTNPKCFHSLGCWVSMIEIEIVKQYTFIKRLNGSFVLMENFYETHHTRPYANRFETFGSQDYNLDVAIATYVFKSAISISLAIQTQHEY